MGSSEHNWGNILETICPEMLPFSKEASWMLLFSEYPEKSHNFTSPHLQLISSTTTTPKCTLRSVFFYCGIEQTVKLGKILPSAPENR